jgi:hypothetical protein
MKTLLIIIAFLLIGCAAKFTIPDEPRYRSVAGYQTGNGVCMDNEDMAALRSNIVSLKDYADKMRKILEELKK